jgi:hypothetical protein
MRTITAETGNGIPTAMFVKRLIIPKFKQNMMSLKGQASWAKMTSLRMKLTAPACHPTKFVNKA